MAAMNPSVVTIENVKVTQLVGSQSLALATGSLVLSKVDENSSLLITVAPFTMVLDPLTTEIGTKGDRTYILSQKVLSASKQSPLSKPSDLKEVALDETLEEEVPSSLAYVQIDMPESATEEALTEFEVCLVEYQFLYSGPMAEADSIARSFMEFVGAKSRALRSFTQARTQGPGTTDPIRFSDTTHETASGVAKGSETFAQATSKVSEAIGGAMQAIGGALGSVLGTRSNEEAQIKSENRQAIAGGAESVKIGAQGLIDATKEMTTAASDSLTQHIDHEYGREAKDLTEHAKKTVNSTASVGVDVALASSMMSHSVEVGKGALGSEQKE